jgi:hypothetical protein
MGAPQVRACVCVSATVTHVPCVRMQAQRSTLQRRCMPLLLLLLTAATSLATWVLRRVDDQLDRVEASPNQLHQALYGLSSGPVGQATSKGVQAAARITVTATIEAAKAAAPVGKWALQQGFKAAVGLAGAAMEQERQQKQREKQREKQQRQVQGEMRPQSPGKHGRQP